MNVFKRLSFSFLCALLLFGCAADWRIFAKETRTSLCPSPVSLEDFSVYEQPDAAAKAYLVMEATTGRVLCGQNIHQQLPMASTTKIIGAMMVLEQPNLHDYFLVDPDAIQVEGSSMGLMEGDMVSLYASRSVPSVMVCCCPPATMLPMPPVYGCTAASRALWRR